MLVLTRKVGQTIRIGDDIVVKVLRLGKTVCAIGIDAPYDVPVLRGELELAVPAPLKQARLQHAGIVS